MKIVSYKTVLASKTAKVLTLEINHPYRCKVTIHIYIHEPNSVVWENSLFDIFM